MRRMRMLLVAATMAMVFMMVPSVAQAHVVCWNTSGQRWCATEASHGPNYRGWAYVVGGTSVQAWRHTGSGFAATTVRGGSWLYISPHPQNGFYWVYSQSWRSWGVMRDRNLMYAWRAG